jgi:predicted transcriptional regulator YdeE
MSKPVFLMVEASPNPDEHEAMMSYLAQAPAVTKEHGGVPVATYDVESALHEGDKAAVFAVISFPSRDEIQAHLWMGPVPHSYDIGKGNSRIGDDAFGIYESYEEQGDEVSFSYVCTVQVSSYDEIPDGMTAREIPEQMYAKFTHTGPVDNLDHTLKYIWGSWLPKSNFDYVEKPDFELYPPGFNDKDPKNKLYLHIPIKRFGTAAEIVNAIE